MTEAPLRFKGVIRIRGINPYVKVSAAQARRLRPEWRRPMPVKIRVNGHPIRAPWKINMMPAGDGSFLLYLHGTVRTASGTAVGDRVALEVSFDAGYRRGPAALPPALSRALKSNPPASTAWKRLTPSRQKEIVRYLHNLKTAAARSRALARVIAALDGSQRRFLARNW